MSCHVAPHRRKPLLPSPSHRHHLLPSLAWPSGPRSGAPTAMSSLEARNPSQRVTIARSKSTSKSRPKSSGHDGDGDEDNDSSNVSSATLKRRQQSNPSGLVVPRMTRLAPPSPSAWALSSGRSLLWAGSLVMEVSSSFNAPRASTKKPESKTNGGGGNGGVVGKVLKYFKRKMKVSPVQEEEIHKLRILHSSLLQWRLANAPAQAAADNTKRNAEEKLLLVWIRIAKMRWSVMEKIIEMRRVRHLRRLYEIMSPWRLRRGPTG
ncbi:hypothetical protein EUGRSUZ_K00991 [Eucalyptus grandis]|uniref:Uncharacterized protein n=2 Tax=Eucalyptus grandis TaxID=71139 RepID=A0ACC3IT99_EUCGR|nr:hypothetical protein EUGRSUZ_K00991 [Eucalyptus grandis]